MVNYLIQLILDFFIISAVLITMYTCNFYYLSYLSSKRNVKHIIIDDRNPSITIQLPIYNEKYVAVRLITSICKLDYPKDKIFIMILDDSDDDTADLLKHVVAKYKKLGFNIMYIHRNNRIGYKAGALKNAMKFTNTEYVAIFDADFIPPNWFLKKTISHFSDPCVGLIQCRWGHLNENYSLLTKAQALSLDFHFLIEQNAKSNSNLFMNFNGTAGIWRKKCIDDSGGWHTATLVEDLDLSYRAQMKGWKCIFLSDIIVNAELPVQMNGAKRQQFRWAKGSIQCAIKLLGIIIFRRKIGISTKIQAFVQLTRHIVFPLILIQFIALPILLASSVNLYVVSFMPIITIAAYLMMGPGAYLIVIHKLWGKKWKSKALVMPYLIIYSLGMSINNTIAVFDAIFGTKNEFLRTPKYGIIKKTDDWKNKSYNLPFTKTTLLEVFFSVYGIIGVLISIFSNNIVFVPIISLHVIGFIYVAYLSISHTKFKKTKSFSSTIINNNKTSKLYYRLSIVIISIITFFGIYAAYASYQTHVYPIDMSRGLLDRIIASSDVNSILDDLHRIKNYLPKDSNPVWLFPTDSTNFVRIQKDLDNLIHTVTILKTVNDKTTFNTGMIDIDNRSQLIKENLVDVTPYVYVSISNIVYSVIWIASILGFFTILKKKNKELSTKNI
ncbi:MAG: glycosyltransferase [Thaumarchaeota archaeon]|nr:glycosyltransferase [Nitrososphaerota archaeon]MCY3976227.1 glycosyltransferase [Nitrososphaerota archaeon]